jgi:cytochrome P450
MAIGQAPARPEAKPHIDLVDPASFIGGQPHDQFDWLRANAPVYRHPKPDGGHFYALTRYEHVRAVGRDHQAFSNQAGGIHIADMPPEALAMARQMMLYMDPPAHHRYRRLVRDPFQPAQAESMRGRIQVLAKQIVDEVAPRGACDLVEDIAGELPSYVIADMLGIPLDDGRRLYHLTETMHAANTPPEEGAAAVMEMIMYAADVRSRKLAEPADDISSALVHGHIKDHGELTPEEFNWFFLLLINAGGDTTRNAVGGGMLALFQHPDELVRLRNNLDTLIPNAVEEILRYCSPVVYMRRTATEGTEVGGIPIEEGEALALYYGAANRDPQVFADPHRFDIAREPNEHIAFGGGVHFCLGVHLARVEIQVMLTELLSRLPDIEQSGDAEWLDSNFISGPKYLPVRFTAAQ